MNHPIILIGPMGAGKSTIGKQLSARLGVEFYDTDHEIEARTGADIPWIFDVEGEAGFRDREQSVLKDLVGKQNAVVATGGGIVVRPENREILKSLPNVIYLIADVEQLVERTHKDKKRPLLQVENPRQKIEQLIAERDPLYRSVASYVLETTGMLPKMVIAAILEHLSD